MSKQLLLVAASGLAREVAESARRAGWDIVGCVDDDPALAGTEIMPGLEVVGDLAAVHRFGGASLLLCAGRGSVRNVMAGRLAASGVDEHRYAVLVDPSVTVPPSCTVGRGSILLAGTTLTACVTIGRHVVCMPRVVLTHDDVVEDYVTLCAGVVLGGNVHVGSRAYLGMSAAVREHLVVERDSVLGMGAVLLTDLPRGELWAGVPAKNVGGRAA